jgi:transposase
MAQQLIAERGERHGVIATVALRLGIGAGSVRTWLMEAEVDQGIRPGPTTAERKRIAQLERENAELRRANEILRSASSFFEAELDRPSKR